MDKQKLARFKERLMQEKKEIEQRIQLNYGLDEQMSDSIHEFALYDNHPADIGTEMFEREKDLALYHLDRETLKEIDQAFQRMEEGTYGICTVCGKPIPEERLEALPQAQTCKEHAPAPIINEDRPVEEEFLQPPFGRTSMDDRFDANFFDGEDAWQIVEQWGTSNTPFAYQDHAKTDYKEMAVESDEPDGIVEPVEQIGYTDIHGYHGPDSVKFMRSGTYETYMDRGEGKGHVIDYDEYRKQLEERESPNDDLS